MQEVPPWGFLSPALAVELESRRAMRQAGAAEAQGLSRAPQLKTKWNAFRSGQTTGQDDEAGKAGTAGHAGKASVADEACKAGEAIKVGKAGEAGKASKADTKGDVKAREGHGTDKMKSHHSASG